jgi:hypothetical protein
MSHIDLTGQRFGRLTVLESAPRVDAYARWRCRCECGTLIAVSSRDLRQGNVKSCGCLRRDTARALGKSQQRRMAARAEAKIAWKELYAAMRRKELP